MTDLIEKQALLALLSEPLKDRVKNTLREQLDDALVCTRTWDAWSVGTMRQDDFECLAHNDDWIEQIADAVLLSLLNKE